MTINPGHTCGKIPHYLKGFLPESIPIDTSDREMVAIYLDYDGVYRHRWWCSFTAVIGTIMRGSW